MNRIAWLLLLVASTASGFDFGSMQANRWYHVTPAYQFGAHGGPGSGYENRHWSNLRYNSDKETLIFYGGFRSPVVGNSCIYANALYEYFPATDEVRLESLANWFCNTGNGGSTSPQSFYPIVGLPDTPKPRHTYSQFVYAASSVYLMHGSMGSDQHLHDFWRYSYLSSSWSKLGDNSDAGLPDVPPTGVNASWANIYDNNLLYHPPSNSLYFFHGMTLYSNPRAIHAYSLGTPGWTMLTGVTNMPLNFGGHGAYDSIRDRFVFFGSAYSGGSSQLYLYDATSRIWTTMSNPGAVPWPDGRDNAGLQYNSSEDVYMLMGADGRRDLWIYQPVLGVWTDLTPSPLPTEWPPNGNEDSAYNLAFHASLNVLVRYDERDGSMWLYRYVSGSAPAMFANGFEGAAGGGSETSTD